MKVTVESITPVKTKLTIDVAAEEVSREENKHLDYFRRNAAVPGFRKGKAPSSAVKRLFGDRAKADAINELIQKSYSNALRENDVHPVADADIEIQNAEDDGSFSFTAIVEVRPKVTPTGYKNLSLKRETLVADPGAVTARLDALREQGATFDAAEEGHRAENGDMVVIDFLGKIDDVPFDGGAAQNHALLLGSGRMIPGFEEGILGAVAGEERTIDVTFPAEYRAEGLAGKDVKFDIKVHEVKKRILPELDDDFARNAAQLETLEELKTRITAMVDSEQKARIDREFRSKIIDLLLAANPFEVPQSIVARQQEHSMERMTNDLNMRGLNPAAMGMDTPEFQEQARAAAERSVRWAFLLDAIAEAENITVTEADVDARIREIAESDGRPVAAIRGFFEKENHMDSLQNSIHESKTMEAILSTAKIEEVDAKTWADWRGDA